MDSRVTIDTSQFQTRIKRLLREMKIEEKDFIREQGQQLALDCARRTPPFAEGKIRSNGAIGTAADKKQGELAVTNDWKKVYRNIGDLGYWENPRIRKLIRSGNIDALTAIMKNVDSKNKGLPVVKYDKSYHQKQRNKRGRLRTGEVNAVIAIPEREVEQGLKKTLETVGTAKAGFLKCAMLLGWHGRSPAWINRNLHRTTSSASLSKNQHGWRADFQSSAAGFQHTIPGLPRLMRERLKKAMGRLFAQYKQAKQKSGLK